MADSLELVISRRFSLVQKAVALAPVLLLLVYLPAQAMLRCRIDGLLRPTCCCPHPSESESASPALEAQDCCAREAAADTRPAPAAAAQPEDRALAHMTAVALAAPSVPALAPSIEHPDWAWQRYGPAREGPPLVLLKHAFLI